VGQQLTCLLQVDWHMVATRLDLLLLLLVVVVVAGVDLLRPRLLCGAARLPRPGLHHRWRCCCWPRPGNCRWGCVAPAAGPWWAAALAAHWQGQAKARGRGGGGGAGDAPCWCSVHVIKVRLCCLSS
jgi:hypothetical protein